MSHLSELEESVRTLIREVLLHDPRFERVNCIRTNKDARIFMRHLIAISRSSCSNTSISLSQMARLVGSGSKRQFIEWLRNNACRPREFRHARWFLNEMIFRNAQDDVRPEEVNGSDSEEDSPIINDNRQLEWPDAESMAHYAKVSEEMRSVMEKEGPRIERLNSATYLIEIIQEAWAKTSDSDSFISSTISDLSETDDFFGEVPVEEKTMSKESEALDLSPSMLGKLSKTLIPE